MAEEEEEEEEEAGMTAEGRWKRWIKVKKIRVKQKSSKKYHHHP